MVVSFARVALSVVIVDFLNEQLSSLWIKIFYAAFSVAVVSSGRSTSLPFSNFAPAHEPLFLALHHIWGKEAPPRHREAVILPCCPREQIRDGLSRGLSRTRMARRSFVQRGQVE